MKILCRLLYSTNDTMEQILYLYFFPLSLQIHNKITDKGPIVTRESPYITHASKVTFILTIAVKI